MREAAAGFRRASGPRCCSGGGGGGGAQPLPQPPPPPPASARSRPRRAAAPAGAPPAPPPARPRATPPPPTAAAAAGAAAGPPFPAPAAAAAAGVRVNKCLRATCSRREADRLVACGRVRVNGAAAAAGATVRRGDVVTLDGAPVDWESLQAELVAADAGAPAAAPGGDARGGDGGADDGSTPLPLEPLFSYLAFWKPAGVVTTTDGRVRAGLAPWLAALPAAASAAAPPGGGKLRLFPVGRLDADSSGLLLLTSDGRLPNALLRASAAKQKVYTVVADRPVAESDLARLRSGVVITTQAQRDGRRAPPLTAPTRPCGVERASGGAAANGCALVVTLTEGRNRQIRRMLAALGYATERLHRTAFAGVTLEGLREGGCRRLTEPEMRPIRAAVRRAAAAAAAADAAGAAQGAQAAAAAEQDDVE